MLHTVFEPQIWATMSVVHQNQQLAEVLVTVSSLNNICEMYVCYDVLDCKVGLLTGLVVVEVLNSICIYTSSYLLTSPPLA